MVDIVSTDSVEALIASHGYEISRIAGDVLQVRDTESGVVLQAVLEENVLFLTVSCIVVGKESITPEVMSLMLAADNGISTSNFQLYNRADGKIAVTLNNFCKLQALGEDDEDDILSCIEFLLADVVAARDVLLPLTKLQAIS